MCSKILSIPSPKRILTAASNPENPIALALLEALEAPIMSTTLILPEATVPLSEPEAIRDILGSQVDLIIDGGRCGHEPTTVVDLTGDSPQIIREGKGDTSPFKSDR